jgi:hypothetical protein
MSDTLELSESSDNGDTWATHEIVEMSGSEQRRPVAVSNGSTVFVVNESGKVYRSSDATTWTKVADLGYMVGPSMVVYGSKIAISYYTFSNTHRLAVSEDGGVTWTSTLVDGAAFGWKAGLSNEGNNLLLAYANSDYSVLKVLKSPDFGKSFSW